MEVSPLKLGVVFPQGEVGADPGAVRDLAQAAESLGFDHLLAYDRQLGIDSARWPEFASGFPMAAPFHEPLTLFAYLAALTSQIEFATDVLVFQTAAAPVPYVNPYPPFLAQ